MSDETVPTPGDAGEVRRGLSPEALRALLAVVGRILVESWPTASADWDVTYSTVSLVELANALLMNNPEGVAAALDELEKRS